MKTEHSQIGAKPRVAVLSSAPSGGAGIAAKRLCDALQGSGRYDADFIDANALGELLPYDAFPQTSLTNNVMSQTHFSVEHVGPSRGWLISLLSQYDIINSHWASMLISLRELDTLSRLNRPMILTCHDFNYFTGGCHYPALCKKFESGCHGCPQVDRDRANVAVVQRNAAIKHNLLARPNVQLTAPSRWLVESAITAGVIDSDRGHVLRNAYIPILHANPRFGIEHQMRILLIADQLGERRKNMMLALKTIGRLAKEVQSGHASFTFELHVVGEAAPEIRHLVETTGVTHTLHGRITDHATLSNVMQSSDIVLTCSDEDNWPNILVEAGVYGCMPVVGPGHGCEEFVKTYNFGTVAWGYAEDAFVDAIKRAITHRTPGNVWRALRRIRTDHNPNLIAKSFAKVVGSAEVKALQEA